MYLQEAGKNDEAWREFNKLIISLGKSKIPFEVLPMEYSLIYDKMRLFLQRENKAAKTIIIGVWAHFWWAKGLFYQERYDELTLFISRENQEKEFTKLLTKAKKEEKLNTLLKIVEPINANIPKINFHKLGEDINKILQ